MTLALLAIHEASVVVFIVHKPPVEDMGSRFALNTINSNKSWFYPSVQSQKFPCTNFPIKPLKTKTNFKFKDPVRTAQ
jgi:hypothetical protein